MVLFDWRAFSIIFLITFHNTKALYEDQIGKFDWRKRHIGKLIATSPIDEKNGDRVLVATEENVIAALSIETGEIIWRQVLEKLPRGEIKYVHFRPEFSSVAASIRNSNEDYDIVTVTGIYPVSVRGWSRDTGNLVFEWSPTVDSKSLTESYWFYKDNHLYHVVPRGKFYVEVTQYYAATGEASAPPALVDTNWTFKGEPDCSVVDTYYVCIDSQNRRRLIAKDLSDIDELYVERVLAEEVKNSPKAMPGYRGILIVNDREIVTLGNEFSKYDAILLRETLDLSLKTDFAQIINYEENDVLITITLTNEILHISPYYLGQTKKAQELGMSVPYPKDSGVLRLLAYNCYKTRVDNPSCSALISTADEAIIFAKDGKIQWVREEALAKIAAVEFIDLPLSGSQSAFETEIQKTTDHNGKSYDIWGAFTRRIQSQLHLLKNIRFHIFGDQPERQKTEITRDAFGLHKMLVILTENGKIFGIDNLSGEIHWAVYHPSLAKFNTHETMKIIVQRTSKHTPHQPLCTIIAKNQKTGNGIVYRFSPISGQAFEDGPVQLGYKIKQMALLRENEKDHTKGILLLDQNNEIHVIPKNATDMADGMYIYVANKTTAIVDGYHIQSNNGKLNLIKTWSINLGGLRQPNNLANTNHMIIAIAAKNPNERVHSQGRVLGDRSVLYKYLNPNLVAIVTAPAQSFNRDMNVHLVDVVSGSIVYSMTHRKVRGPVHIVNSENWLVYSYFNDKARRTELTTVELYEGKVQSNSTVWSSLEAPPFPIIEKQSFIIPTSVEAMRETITERGITNKHVLLGTSSGGVVEMAWIFLDPRRPTTNQAREEGSIPYIPELGIPSETVINYNQSIARLKDISTAPSGLESTCLVVAHGLDLFVTRVSPSKTFDLLKEDFDYMLISSVLIGLIVVSSIVQHLSSRKALKQAWK